MRETEEELESWWKDASTLKRRLAVIAGIIASIVTIGAAAIGGIEIVGDFTTNTDRINSLESTVEQELVPLAPRVARLETRLELRAAQLDSLQTRNTFMLTVLAELRCRARVADGVLPNYTSCWSDEVDEKLQEWLGAGTRVGQP